MKPTPRDIPPDQVLVSLVLPVFNEAGVLETLHRALSESLVEAGTTGEMVFINDGSSDASPQILDRLAGEDHRVRVLHLSRNFGHQAAVQAGLAHARGHAVIVMDSDLQDDPRSLKDFLARWHEGYDVVYAIRYGRKEAAWKVFLFHGFYRVLNRLSATPMPSDAGNFGLIDRRVAREIAGLMDRDRYYAGLRSWVGFKQIGIPVERGPRYDGTPRVKLLGLWRLAKSAIFSFSSVPLSIFYAIAFLGITVFVLVAVFTLYHRLFTHMAIPGWTSGLLTTSFLGALNALGIAILGEYVARIYDQVRVRPLYVVDRAVNFDESDGTSRAPGA